jgi:hypothetical protein
MSSTITGGTMLVVVSANAPAHSAILIYEAEWNEEATLGEHREAVAYFAREAGLPVDASVLNIGPDDAVWVVKTDDLDAVAYRQDEDEAWTIHRMAADGGSIDDACAVLDIMRSNGVDESTARGYLADEWALQAEESAAQNASNHGLCADCGRSVATHVADDGEDTKVCRRCLLERWRYGFMHSADAGDTWLDWIAGIDSRMIGSVV